MKITTFNPEIISTDGDSVIKLFEELGFVVKHRKTEVEGQDITITRMADPNGFHLDVVSNPYVEHDKSLIRMNVDNFEETYELLTSYDFRNAKYNEVPIFTENAKQSIMISPSGFEIDLCHHIKNIFYQMLKKEKK